jgi:hypothetical protein
MIPIMSYYFDLPQLFFLIVILVIREESYNRVLVTIFLILKQMYDAKRSTAIVNMPAILTVENSL